MTITHSPQTGEFSTSTFGEITTSTHRLIIKRDDVAAGAGHPCLILGEGVFGRTRHVPVEDRGICPDLTDDRIYVQWLELSGIFMRLGSSRITKNKSFNASASVPQKDD
ncbi:hypothetical protein [Komagataeibacter xylinus]|nr:hypothetical protein [Komagataeibacter xylinus]